MYANIILKTFPLELEDSEVCHCPGHELAEITCFPKKMPIFAAVRWSPRDRYILIVIAWEGLLRRVV